MDDRELEARLRVHLHHRLDGLDAPRELRASVEQVLRTPAGPVRGSGVWFQPRMRVGFSLAAAAVLVVALAIAFGVLHGPTSVGPGGSPSPTTPPGRTFIVLPPGSTVPSKADSSLAADVLEARLRAIGLGSFSAAGGIGVVFELAAEPAPADEVIRAVLGATGEVEFVPLPPADYGDSEGSGPLTATIGQPLPKAEPALFGREGVASVKLGDASPGNPSPLDITLTPAAGQALAAWTTGHVGEYLAIVVDSTVVLVPAVREPITDGALTIAMATDTAPAPAEGLAVLIGGMLPESWRGASVVEPISRDAAAAAALAATQGGTIEYEGTAPAIGDLGPLGTWRVWWDVQVGQAGCLGASPCPSEGPLLVRVDAATGEVFHIGHLVP